MEELYARIEDYLDDHLDAAGRTAFEDALLTDPALAEALAQVREARERLSHQWAGDAADRTLAATLNAVGRQHFAPEQPPPPRRTWRRLALAAAAASAAILVIWLVWPSSGPERLYAEYRRFPEAALVTRAGDADQTDRAAATAAFNRGDYQTALPLLQRLRQNRPDDAELGFFTALCLLELGQTRAAVGLLEPLRASSNSWAGEASWYLALSYLQEKNTAQASATLRQIATGAPHYDEAQQLLTALDGQ